MDCCPHCGGKPDGNTLVFVYALGEVRYGDKVAHLTPMEMDIFEMLHESFPRPVSRELIMDNIWRRSDREPSDNLLVVYMSKMRKNFRESGIPVNIVSTDARYGRAGYSLTFHDVADGAKGGLKKQA